MSGLLKFITCGSVDDGKSTLIGHILYDSKLLYADQEKALILDSKVGSRGGAIDYSLLLDGLKERNVRVSFFLLGEKVEQYPELVERMQKEGHLVGNHTYHHVQLNKLNETKAREEILKTNNLIYETTGVYPLYLRPPFGAVWCLEEKSGTMCGDASCILDDRYTGLEGEEHRKDCPYREGTD